MVDLHQDQEEQEQILHQLLDQDFLIQEFMLEEEVEHHLDLHQEQAELVVEEQEEPLQQDLMEQLIQVVEQEVELIVDWLQQEDQELL
jgi:hypothetical protein